MDLLPIVFTQTFALNDVAFVHARRGIYLPVYLPANFAGGFDRTFSAAVKFYNYPTPTTIGLTYAVAILWLFRIIGAGAPFFLD